MALLLGLSNWEVISCSDSAPFYACYQIFIYMFLLRYSKGLGDIW
jgi:hypothetical protein